MCRLSDGVKYCRGDLGDPQASQFNSLNSTCQHPHPGKLRRRGGSDSETQHNHTLCICIPGPQLPGGGTNLQKNSQDNDKLPPDLAAARSIIHVAEHRAKKFYSVTHILP